MFLVNELKQEGENELGEKAEKKKKSGAHRRLLWYGARLKDWVTILTSGWHWFFAWHVKDFLFLFIDSIAPPAAVIN